MNDHKFLYDDDYYRKSEHAKTSAEVMDEGMQLTLFEIRSLPETWNCPQEEKL